MTDNRTTELKKLSKLKMAGKLRYWRGTIEIPEGELHAICDEIQAEHEQTIAATLDGGKLTAEQVRHASHEHYKLRMVRDADGLDVPQVTFDWHAIADELNAVLMNGTYIALPTDAAGEPIHVGDVLESTNAFKNWCVVMGIGDATKHDHIIYVKFEAAGDISQTWASKFIHRKPDAERGERKAVER